MKIGFIGVGNIGAPIAGQLLTAGHALDIDARDQPLDLADAGERRIAADEIENPRHILRAELLGRREAGLPVRAFEYIILVDPLPRQVAPSLAQLVAQPGEFLFPGQQFLPRRQPFLARHHPMLIHDDTSLHRRRPHRTSSAR